MSDIQNILNSYNDYNIAYSDWKTNCDPTPAPDQTESCLLKYTNLTDKSKIIETQIDSYNENYDIKFQDYLKSQTELYNKYSDVLKKRNNLDMKMNELMNNKDTIASEYKTLYDSNVYTTVLWTALATSIIYYTFLKISNS